MQKKGEIAAEFIVCTTQFNESDKETGQRFLNKVLKGMARIDDPQLHYSMAVVGNKVTYSALITGKSKED